MFATGIRTVEFCRRWGIAERVRDWGFPRDFPFDNVFVTASPGTSSRASHAVDRATRRRSRRARRISRTARSSCSIRSSARRRATLPAVTLRYGSASQRFVEHADHVVATGNGEIIQAAISSAATAIPARCASRSLSTMEGTSCSTAPSTSCSARPSSRRCTTRAMPAAMSRSARKARGRASPPRTAATRWRLMLYDEKPEDPQAAVRCAAPWAGTSPSRSSSVGYWARRNLVAERLRHRSRIPRRRRGARRCRPTAASA